MILCEEVVSCVLRCGCIGFGVGVGVRVIRILPWRRWDVVRVVTGVFSLKVCLYFVDDSWWVCCDFVGDWVVYDFKFGLVFGVKLQARAPLF